MSTEEAGKETLLGQLRDEGYTPYLVNRVEELLEAFNGNVAQFCAATRGQLNATYVKTHPETKLKGLGEKTFEVFDRFVQLWKQSRFDARQIAKATVEAQEAKAAEREAMRLQLLDRELEFDSVTSAMAALETLGVKKCKLGRLLELYDMAREAKQ